MIPVFVVYLLIFCYCESRAVLWKVCDETFPSVSRIMKEWQTSQWKGKRKEQVLFCTLVSRSKRISARLHLERRRYLGKTSVFILQLWCEIWETSTECSAIEERDAGLLKALVLDSSSLLLVVVKWSLQPTSGVANWASHYCLKQKINQKMYWALLWISFTIFFYTHTEWVLSLIL